VPEGDEQVGRQAHALPADVEGHEVVAEDQQQHRRDEQVQVGEEPPATRVVRHVADRVDVDQRAHAGDQQDEDRRERVEQQAGLHVQRPGGDEGEQVDVEPPAVQLQRAQQAEQEGRDDRAGAQQVPPPVGAPSPEQQDGGAGQRQRDEQPGGGDQPVGRCGVHPRSPSLST
jgi:hypothetical protein